MNYLAFIILLISLAGLNLIVLLVMKFLDHLSTNTRSKLNVIKMSLFLIFIAPFAFVILKLSAWNTITINLPLVSHQQKILNNVSVFAPLSTTDWAFYIFAAYMSGFFIMCVKILLAYFAASKQLSDSRQTEIQGQTVFLNEQIYSPLSFGLPKARIYLPANIQERLSERELALSLAHERIHVMQHDGLWKLLSLFVQAILFFAPWSDRLHKRFELELEKSCDEKTCLATDANTNEYGNLLLAMVCAQPNDLIFTHLSDNTLKRRIVAMKSITKKRPLLISLISIALISAASITVAMSSGFAAKNSSYEISTKIIIDGKEVSNPRIMATANNPAYLSFSNADKTESMKLRVVASDVAETGNPIDLRFDIFYKNKEINMSSQPRFIILSGQEGKINVSNETHQLELIVLAKRE